ncbi:MAG: DJ-1/PfpI family protein [Nostoc sp.]|uniref:DJ-1/PfpI family protein n=1 Tax=Nostoc sp. TaxID=1180 RepID=UPI002FF90596
MLFVPGGPGINAKMEDEKFLNFLKIQGKQARYVTAVCTGSLLLAAAGLLQGYRATTGDRWICLRCWELRQLQKELSSIAIELQAAV